MIRTLLQFEKRVSCYNEDPAVLRSQLVAVTTFLLQFEKQESAVIRTLLQFEKPASAVMKTLLLHFDKRVSCCNEDLAAV